MYTNFIQQSDKYIGSSRWFCLTVFGCFSPLWNVMKCYEMHFKPDLPNCMLDRLVTLMLQEYFAGLYQHPKGHVSGSSLHDICHSYVVEISPGFSLTFHRLLALGTGHCPHTKTCLYMPVESSACNSVQLCVFIWHISYYTIYMKTICVPACCSCIYVYTAK